MYDSWGKQTSCTGTLATTLGVQNPFRYRGYFYDAETGWYYLQSRYYNPEVGRFLSADALMSTGQGVLGYNMYAYCGNNPVNTKDSFGNEVEENDESGQSVTTTVYVTIPTPEEAAGGAKPIEYRITTTATPVQENIEKDGGYTLHVGSCKTVYIRISTTGEVLGSYSIHCEAYRYISNAEYQADLQLAIRKGRHLQAKQIIDDVGWWMENVGGIAAASGIPLSVAPIGPIMLTGGTVVAAVGWGLQVIAMLM